MFDLVIRGDQVVTSEGTGRWDVCIRGETIAAVALAGGTTPLVVARLIRTTGNPVAPAWWVAGVCAISLFTTLGPISETHDVPLETGVAPRPTA